MSAFQTEETRIKTAIFYLQSSVKAIQHPYIERVVQKCSRFWLNDVAFTHNFGANLNIL